MGLRVSNRHGSLAKRSVGHWRGHHGGCLLDFVCLGCVKCDLWLGGFRYGGWLGLWVVDLWWLLVMFKFWA